METVRKGDSGAAVQELTKRLVDIGLLDKVQNQFDEEVERAVKAWQVHGVDDRGRKLTVDGIAGPLTWSSLEGSSDDVFTEPVPERFYDLQDGGNTIGRVALQFGLQEMWNDAREIDKNNAGKFVEKYHRRDDASELQWSWCAAFTSWCFHTASDALDVEMPFNYTGGAQDVYNQLKEKGCAYTASADNPPQPGDICVWWRGDVKSWKGHVGIVWGYQNGIVYILEGNVGRFPARVRVFDYVLGRMKKLIGFARPKV